LHQLRHLATVILKDEADMSLAKLQRFLRHEHQRTTEIRAGHIETGTKKQADFLADFWTDKLDLIDGHESIPEIVNQEK
jgi:integrase